LLLIGASLAWQKKRLSALFRFSKNLSANKTVQNSCKGKKNKKSKCWQPKRHFLSE
jgi:hypothetical protein